MERFFDSISLCGIKHFERILKFIDSCKRILLEISFQKVAGDLNSIRLNTERKSLEIFFKYIALNCFRDIDKAGNDLAIVESTEIESVADYVNPIRIPVGIPNTVLSIHNKTV